VRLLLLLACADEGAVPESSGAAPAAYAGPVGRILEYAGMGDPQGDTRFLAIQEGSWDWSASQTDASTWITRLTDEGLWVDEAQVLPERLAAGARAPGVEVTAVGEAETWYGTFPDTVTVDVEEGVLAGPTIWARDIGPVLITVQGWSGELVYYE